MKTKTVSWSIKLGLAGLTTIATTLAIVGCDTQEVDSVEASVDGNLVPYNEPTTFLNKAKVQEFVDTETGVHYLLVADKWGKGNGGIGSITPMYNADGTLKVD